jgi:voltage-gated potassium channel
LTTVGYGDIFPITSLGKILGSISAIFGIGFFALPAGLLATGFSDEIKKEKSFCPHCGEKLPSD